MGGSGFGQRLFAILFRLFENRRISAGFRADFFAWRAFEVKVKRRIRFSFGNRNGRFAPSMQGNAAPIEAIADGPEMADFRHLSNISLLPEAMNPRAEQKFVSIRRAANPLRK